MTFEVIVTAAAEDDITEIWRYIATHDSIPRADYVVNALEETIALLLSSPNVGNVPKELQSLGLTQYRELHWKPYRIVYETEGRKVLVQWVLDGRRNVDALLQERLLR
jgi:toxin ParE1/3/4